MTAPANTSSGSLSEGRNPFLYYTFLDPNIAEPIENYYADGLHPVHLNDIVSTSDNSRYRILHKLGSGGFSTVWFGQNLDKTHPGYRGVAVKFIAAIATGKNHEVEINKFLASRSSEDAGFQNLALCLDAFQVSGPNGVHDVIVSEPALLLPDLFRNNVIEHLDESLIFQQALSGVGFIHTHGVVHRDLHLWNIAIEFPFLRTAGVPALMKGSGRPVCQPFVSSTPCDSLPSLPKYIVQRAMFCRHLTVLMETDFTVKIIDFGCSFRLGVHELPDPDRGRPLLKPPECNLLDMITWENTYSTGDTSPSGANNADALLSARQKREAALQSRDLSDLAWSTQGDMWVLGCTFFLIMVRDHFHVFQRGYGGGAAFFRIVAEYVGPLPDRYRHLLEEAANAGVDRPWESKNCAEALDIDPSLADPTVIENNWVGLEEEVLKSRRYWRTRSTTVPSDDENPSFDNEDRNRVRVYLTMIRRMLRWCPGDRITASDAALLTTSIMSNFRPTEAERESASFDFRPEPRETESLSSLEDQHSGHLWEVPSGTGELESLSRYHAGGLHPVHYTERYNDGQYRILNKLGFGSSSHVWLAEDTTTKPLSRPLALKFIEAKANERTLEIEIHKYLTSLADEPGSKHIIPLLNTFQVEGPNGVHNVIVSDAVAFIPALCKRKTIEDLDEIEIVRQTIQGVSFLHAHGVVHRDLHCGNIGIEIPLFRTAGIRQLAKSPSPIIFPCIPSEAAEHPRSLPKYVVHSTPALSSHRKYFKDAPGSLVVKLVDFGCAFRPGIDAVPEGSPRRALTAPECLVSEIALPEKVWTFESDIWTLGCTLVEIILA
ncbi:kinase-like domain-containing protein [Roridomyces roridus]|uniref:Kinase-like domain-containing protein n=1 Tax=Roridomyces roridus TaxID=1738132 RepID=A0AAD7FH27_9AGAR|nr:kinase-like domain-containing protein [Roridomyces roridus]